MALTQQDWPPDTAADPVDEALQNSASSLRSPRMFDADDTSALEGERALEARQVDLDLGA